MERPSGSWIENPETGELTPNLDDEAMAARYNQPDEEPVEEDDDV